MFNEFNQLGEVIFYEFVCDFAESGKVQAIRTLRLFGQAGARAYIYTNAGIDIVQPKKLLEENTKLLEESKKKDNVIKLQKLTIRQQADKSLKNAMRTKHQILMELVENGYLTAEHRQCHKWIYTITAKGKLAGYTLNKNGTVVHPQ